MSSVKESLAGSTQPGYFKCLAHETPDAYLSMKPFHTTNSLWWSKNKLYISLGFAALLIPWPRLKTSNYKTDKLFWIKSTARIYHWMAPFQTAFPPKFLILSLSVSLSPFSSPASTNKYFTRIPSLNYLTTANIDIAALARSCFGGEGRGDRKFLLRQVG